MHTRGNMPRIDLLGPGCVICMEDFDLDNDVIHTLPCDHKFHQRCIDGFVASQERPLDLCKCPMCRSDVGEGMIALLMQHKTRLRAEMLQEHRDGNKNKSRNKVKRG